MTLNGLIEILKIKTLKYEIREGLIVCDLQNGAFEEYKDKINVLLKSMYAFLKVYVTRIS